MSAFGNMGDDIDRTPRGVPYIVDASGWGWFALFVFALVPVVTVGLVLRGFAASVAKHPVWTCLIYFAIVIIIGVVSYNRKGLSWNITGIAATVLTFLPLIIVEMLIEVPNILIADDSIGAIIGLLFEWIFVTLMLTGISIFIQALNLLSISPRRHLIVAVLYCCVACFILTKMLTTENMEAFYMVYNLAG